MLVPRKADVLVDPNARPNWLAGTTGAVTLAASEQQDEAASGDVLGAAFRQENIIGSLVARQWSGGEAVPDYNPWDEIKGTAYEERWESFVNVVNPGQTAAMKRQIDMEIEDRNTLAMAGGWGMLASMGASIFSPENLLPGGAIVRGSRMGASMLRSAASVGTAAALSAGVSELALHATQEVRTPLDTAFNVGGAAVIGGALGAALTRLFAAPDYARVTKAFEDEGLSAADGTALAANEAAMLNGILDPASAGAAARAVDTLEDNTIAGQAAQVAGGAVRGLNPVLRILHSPSAAVRSIGTALFENPIYMKKNMEGRASDPAVETLVKEYTQGAMARAVEGSNGLYAEYRKAAGQLSRGDFNEAVGRAMRRADQDADPHIAKAAQLWRSTVFDPLKDAAIKAGLLPADVNVTTAMSYFSRVYNRPRIVAREAEFKGIVRRYIDQELRAAQTAAALNPKADIDVPDFLSDADRAGYVEQIVGDIFNSVTGRNVDGNIPRDIVVSQRGPLKERTFNIPDEMIEDFLESNVEAVGRRYARVMGADVEMKNSFGSVDLKEQIAGIRNEYATLRAEAANDEKLTAPQKEKRARQLDSRERADIRDIEALRDMLRGTYLARENSTNYARVARVAGTVNYLRLMGGVTLSSLADISRHVMVHGFGNVMRDGLVPLIGNLRSFKMAVAEARLAGAVTERLLNTRLATWADLTDPYSVSSPFERFMDNTATGFSKLNGLVYWNDFHKSFASVITQNRVLRGVGKFDGLGQREKAYLAYLGIDADMAGRIAKQFEKHGSEEAGGVRVAGSDDWDDEWARRVYRAAINKDVDSTIITKGVGDVPLFMHTPTGRLLTQFKSFAIASHQRALMRGLQERPMGFLSGTMLAVSTGMLIYYLKSIETNRPMSDNPGRWIAEGLDRSGLFSIAFEVNNTVEKAFGVGAYGALAAMFPEASQSGKSSRYLNRGMVETLAGPTAALVDTVVAAGNAIKPDGSGWTESEINTVKRLMPGLTLPGIRSLVEYAGP